MNLCIDNVGRLSASSTCWRQGSVQRTVFRLVHGFQFHTQFQYSRIDPLLSGEVVFCDDRGRNLGLHLAGRWDR